VTASHSPKLSWSIIIIKRLKELVNLEWKYMYYIIH